MFTEVCKNFSHFLFKSYTSINFCEISMLFSQNKNIDFYIHLVNISRSDFFIYLFCKFIPAPIYKIDN